MSQHKPVRAKRPHKALHKSKTLRARRHIGGLALVVIGLAAVAGCLWLQPSRHSNAASCSVSDTLVNSCRPWLGAAVNNYPQVGIDQKSQFEYHEKRIGRKLDIVHTYHGIGQNQLTSASIEYAKRDGTYLFANWKPTGTWREADGRNSDVNAGIDKMAASVRSVAPKKIFMTIHHEPENDVSGGASGCTGYRGSAGTPQDYKNMWRNVHNRFQSAGATNVVWVMDYMNYDKWDCMVDDLYPGNDLVDWIMFNGYGAENESWKADVSHFYNLLSSTNSSANNYLSKPWGIVEWGYKDGTAAQNISWFNQARDTLNSNAFPRLKAYMIFDARHKGAANGANYQVAYAEGQFNQAVQDAYNTFANHPRLVGNGVTSSPGLPQTTPGKDASPPVVRLVRPSGGITESGGMNIEATATDNIGIKAVTLRVDGKYVETDDRAPYTFRLDTTTYANGKHSIVVRAWDTSNNMSESQPVVVTFNNSGVVARQSQPPSAGSTTIVASKTTTSAVPAEGILIVQPSQEGGSVQVWIDGKLHKTNTIDSVRLTNGVHTIRISENGVISTQLVTVHNPFAIAAYNSVRANASTYGAAAGVVLAVAGFWILRPYLSGLTSSRERKITKAQRSVSNR